METGSVRLSEFGLAQEHRVDHVPTGWRALARILPRSEVGQGDVFIDFGSGMGRIVVQAARNYPFRRVIGVEISPELYEIEMRNVDRNRHRLRCKNVELVNADVLDYHVPDDVTIAYFYNPFTGPIFEHVLAELCQSVERNPREIRIIYLCPREEDRLLARAGIDFVRTASAGQRHDRSIERSIRLYVLRPTLQEAETVGPDTSRARRGGYGS